MGTNSGIGDAVDLGWKLGCGAERCGGEGFLFSYDVERRPIGTRNVRMTTSILSRAQKFGDGIAAIEDDGHSSGTVNRYLPRRGADSRFAQVSVLFPSKALPADLAGTVLRFHPRCPWRNKKTATPSSSRRCSRHSAPSTTNEIVAAHRNEP